MRNWNYIEKYYLDEKLRQIQIFVSIITGKKYCVNIYIHTFSDKVTFLSTKHFMSKQERPITISCWLNLLVIPDQFYFFWHKTAWICHIMQTHHTPAALQILRSSRMVHACSHHSKENIGEQGPGVERHLWERGSYQHLLFLVTQSLHNLWHCFVWRNTKRFLRVQNCRGGE